MEKPQHSDALLLYAVAYCYLHDGVASLRGIFSATDAIYRIAPTFDELEFGLTRLRACNLLVETIDGYLPTDEGLSLYQIVNEAEGSVFDHIDLLTKKLENLCTHPQIDKKISLDPEAVEKARQSHYGN